MKLLVFLDYFFIVFHTLFTLFNMTGWAFKRTRKAHLVTMILTSSSWFILGIWYGWGYCFCTDWHWQVREALGRRVVSGSYIHFLLLEITGYDFPQHAVDAVTLAVFAAAALLTLYLNIRDGLITKRIRNN